MDFGFCLSLEATLDASQMPNYKRTWLVGKKKKLKSKFTHKFDNVLISPHEVDTYKNVHIPNIQFSLTHLWVDLTSYSLKSTMSF